MLRGKSTWEFFNAQSRPSRGSVTWIVDPALTCRAFLCRPFGAGVGGTPDSQLAWL